MLIRRKGLGEESPRASLARRLGVVADIRRHVERTPLLNRRVEQPRVVAVERHQPGQGAA